MNFIEDFCLINKISLKKTWSGIKRSWYIIFVGFLYWALTLIVFSLLNIFLRGPLSILRDIFTTLFVSSLVSNYLVMIQLTVLNRKISLDNFKEGFKYYVWKIYGIFFFMYLITYLLQLLGMGIRTNVGLLTILLYISFFILLNALPEAIYLKNYDPKSTIEYTLEFMKDNWVQWSIPNILIGVFLYFAFGGLSKYVLNGLDMMNKTFLLKGFLKSLVSQFFVAIFMIYRGNLFYILSNSTRRNRVYKYGREIK